MKNRRDFIKILSLGGASVLLTNSAAASSFYNRKKASVRFGICADVHKDIMHDADERLQAFIDDASEKNLDFIIQLGDFCRPYSYNNGFMNVWNSFPGKKYHVIGNHDMDGGFTREQVVDFWNAEGRFYSFDCKGYHFIVLDGNDKDPSPNAPAGYARFIGQEQLDWLKKDIKATSLPCILFSHQGLDNDMGGIANSTACRMVFESANKEAGFEKVQFVFSGHHHQDYHNYINDICYVQINSMSYQWLGEKYQHIRYGKAIDKDYPWIKYTVPYKDPLWAVAELSADNTLRIHGITSEFVGPSPHELGVDMNRYVYPIVPYISDKKLQ